MCAPTPLIEESATLKLRPLCGRLASWLQLASSHLSAMAQGGTKREGTGCSMSGVRIFLRTYIRVAASETSIWSCG